jgi:hypothetical protein
MMCNAQAGTPGGTDGTTDPNNPDKFGMWRFITAEQPGELNAFQHLLLSLLKKGFECGYKRHRTSIMTPILTKEGLPTGAWRKKMSFLEFVLSITQDKLTNSGLWFYLTRSLGNIKAAVDYLKISLDPEIPWLFPDRRVFAFRNGLYDALNERFVPYTQFSEVYPLGPPTACKYFDMAVDLNIFKYDDYMSIPTKAFDQLLEPQEMSQTLIRWVFALFIGRLLYDVGELDDWQIHPFVKGMSNTGKTKLLEAIAAIYDYEDVGFLPNNIEEQFGLGIIAKKFIAIADDVRRNLKLDQSDFQNMASGTTVSCPVKFNDPIVVMRWACGVVWSGNEVPDWHDNAGSYSRRLAVLLFSKVVSNPDGSLGNRLLEELPYIIIKGNWAYRNMIRRYSQTAGIWSLLPQELQDQRKEIATTSNALAGFLESKDLVFGNECYMPLSLLRDKCKKFATNNNYVMPKWCADYWRGPIALKKLHIENEEKKWPRIQDDKDGNPLPDPKMKNQAYVIGCEPK